MGTSRKKREHSGTGDQYWEDRSRGTNRGGTTGPGSGHGDEGDEGVPAKGGLNGGGEHTLRCRDPWIQPDYVLVKARSEGREGGGQRDRGRGREGDRGRGGQRERLGIARALGRHRSGPPDCEPLQSLLPSS